MSHQERIQALRQALDLSPDNHPLRLMLAEALQAAGETAAALAEYKILLEADQIGAGQLVSLGKTAVAADDLDMASRCLDAALKAGIIEGIRELRTLIDQKLEEQGYVRVVAPTGSSAASTAVDAQDEQDKITFADVGGLDDIKKVIHKLIILPLLRPDVYQKYGRKAGGGVLLYGPPGCGKTMLARATAGECDLPFFNIRIEDILDPYMGVSERNLHRAFEYTRARTPCVLFIDELDAIAFARRKHTGSSGRSLVDQLLQELDAIGSDNQNLLILAATNAPWDIDDALMRPGRFDRRIFVSPPDEKARLRILELLLSHLPQQKINNKSLAKATPLFSGADLQAMVNMAVDFVIDEALESGSEPPLTMSHLERAQQDLRPTTLDWLERAQNYVEFANQDKRYDEVAKFLRSREVRKWGK
jgi:SpoVK/Ycf46/Vps4 family AAA+-type ATPase